MSVEKRSIIAGNWKMYKTLREALDFVTKLVEKIDGATAEVLLAVPFTMIREVSQKADSIKIGAQNMNDASEGAFTGEISARMLKDAGATFVILGHSERRGHYKETDDFINKKVRRALSDGLQVILCVGESFEDHESGQIAPTLEKQVLDSLKEVKPEDFKNIVIAYEPVWAIGSGTPANPSDVATEIETIRAIVANQWGKNVGKELKILYGGSVNPENAKDFLSEPTINGVLIGSASLYVDDFAKIISES